MLSSSGRLTQYNLIVPNAQIFKVVGLGRLWKMKKSGL